MKRFILFVALLLWVFMASSNAQDYREKFHGYDKEYADHLRKNASFIYDLVDPIDTTIITGGFHDALGLSIAYPKYVGVYMMIDSNYHHTTDDLLPGVMSYFEHYKIPAVFVKQAKPYKKRQASVRIYINGKAYEGDLSNGNISLFYLRDDHEELFSGIINKYDKINSATEKER